MLNLSTLTVKVICGGNEGTAFFISPTILLTSRHVTKEYKAAKIQVANYNGYDDEILGEFIDQCDQTDISIFKIPDENANTSYLQLCKSEIIKDEQWESYGYPKTNDGHLIGEPLDGTILRYIEDSELTIHDVSITLEGNYSHLNKAGYSGSPLIDLNEEVIAVIRYENESYLSAVSIKKACKFLLRNNIVVLNDKLKTFEKYKAKAFDTFEDLIKTYCESFVQKFEHLSPGQILDELQGNVYFPERRQPREAIIAYLRKNEPLNSELWKGWVRFLTYIEILKGNYSSIKDISLTLEGFDANDVLGVESVVKNVSVTVNIKFRFTEEKQFFPIARKFIMDKDAINEPITNTCHIFNSIEPLFGTAPFSAKHKEDIIENISSPTGAGFSIPGKLQFGILSLLQLTTAVGASVPTTANINLKKLLKDAIAKKH